MAKAKVGPGNTDGDTDMLDGYEDLPSDLQEKIAQAFEDGHVADDDWRGDPEQNRPGMKGFRSPARKKSRIGDDNVDKSPSKAASKKRVRGKKEDLEDQGEEPAQKKIKAAPKKEKKAKSGEDADDMAIDAPVPATSKVVAKKGRPAKVKESEPDKVGEATKKAAAKKKVPNKEEAADKGQTAPAVPTKPKAAGKRGKKADEESAEAPATETQPTKAAGRPRKTKVDDGEVSNAAAAGNDQAAKTAANTKKPIAKKADAKANAETAHTRTEHSPRIKKGRKKSSKSP
ncbi:MAG: hypothetical protein Q9184_000536 [Pyrenodesmia sp. 2 TL-2023]